MYNAIKFAYRKRSEYLTKYTFVNQLEQKRTEKTVTSLIIDGSDSDWFGVSVDIYEK